MFTRGKLYVGVNETFNSPEAVETLALAGMDFVWLDMMFSSKDWDRTAHMVRAARCAKIIDIVRLPSNPWVTKGEDKHLAIDMTRAFGIGATGIMFSPATIREIEMGIEVGKDWHRGIHMVPFADDVEKLFLKVEKQTAAESIVMPLIESVELVRNIEEALSVDGLKTAFLGISDATRMLGHPMEYEHPEVWQWIDKAVKVADKHGVVLGGNTGYSSQNVVTIGQRIKRLYDHGIGMVLVQNTGALMQFFCRDFKRRAIAEVEGKASN